MLHRQTVTLSQLTRLNHVSFNVSLAPIFPLTQNLLQGCVLIWYLFIFVVVVVVVTGYESRESGPAQLAKMLLWPQEKAQTSHQVLTLIPAADYLGPETHLHCNHVTNGQKLNVMCKNHMQTCSLRQNFFPG